METVRLQYKTCRAEFYARREGPGQMDARHWLPVRRRPITSRQQQTSCSNLLCSGKPIKGDTVGCRNHRNLKIEVQTLLSGFLNFI